MYLSSTFTFFHPDFKFIAASVWRGQRLLASYFVKTLATIPPPFLPLVHAQPFSNKSTTIFYMKKISSEIVGELIALDASGDLLATMLVGNLVCYMKRSTNPCACLLREF